MGRRRELAVLARALAGPPAVVLLEGEAGIGKSRLIREVLAGLGEPTVLIGFCPPFREPHTLGPVVDAVRDAADRVAGLGLSALAGSLRPVLPEWADELPPAPEPPADPRAARHLLFRALAELIQRLGHRLLVVEDLHWADEATIDFLVFLAARPGARPSLVLSYRPEDMPAGSPLHRLPARLPAAAPRVRLSLAPLDRAATAQLVATLLGGPPVGPELVGFLHRHTAGIPLAVEELVRVMCERADLSRHGQRWRWRPDRVGVPPTIRDAVLERAGRLGPPAQAVLRAAAVLADPDQPAALATVGGLDQEGLDRGLVEAVRGRLLGEDRHRRVGFRHALAARAVYEAIPPAERRALHLRAARLLESRSPPPMTRLVRHFREAGEAAAWFRYAELAADRALRSGDEASATALLAELVESPDLPPGRVARLVDKLPFLGLVRPAQAAGMVGALRRARDGGSLAPAERAYTQVQLALMLYRTGEREASAVEAEQALGRLPPDSAGAARAMILLGRPELPALTAATHVRWLQRSAEAAASLPAGERLGVAVMRVWTLLRMGEDRWEEAARLAADVPDTLPWGYRVEGQVCMADAAILWGRYDEAERRVVSALALAAQHEFPALRDAVLSTRASLCWLIGEWDGLSDRAAALTGEPDVPSTLGVEASLVGALVRSATGAVEAEQDLRRVLPSARHHGSVEHYFVAAAALGRRHLMAGEVDRSLTITDDPIEIVTGKQIWLLATDLVPVRVEALVAAGRVGAAGELVAGFGQWLHGRRIPSARAALSRARGTLAEGRGEYARAAALYRRAARAWQAMPRPYEALLAEERAGECLATAGDTAAGVALLSGAMSGLSVLGARRDADRVLRRLRALGSKARRSGPGGRPGYGDRLSPRELQVVRLVREGRTNRQIAAELVVSVQTVASHLRSTMRKLHVSSRTAVAVRALELGLVPGTAEPEQAATEV